MCGRIGVPGCQGRGPGLEFVGDDRGPLCFSPVSRWSTVAVGLTDRAPGAWERVPLQRLRRLVCPPLWALGGG